MVATRSQASINSYDKSKIKTDDSKFVEESSELQNLNLNLFSHISSRNYKVQPIQSITKASNSLIEDDVTACEMINAVKCAKPVCTPEG